MLPRNKKLSELIVKIPGTESVECQSVHYFLVNQKNFKNDHKYGGLLVEIFENVLQNFFSFFENRSQDH